MLLVTLSLQMSIAVPTWEDVRPIVASQCAVCHKPGGEGPFRLDRASDLAARQRFAAAVVEQGVMPPWLPQSNSTAMHGRGALSAPDRKMLVDWLKAGAPHPKDAKPAIPVDEAEGFEESITLDIDSGFSIPAESLTTLHAHTHNTRTFAMPLVNDEPLLVTGVQWRTPIENAVHSVAFSFDPTGQAEIADSLEEPAGYHMSGDLGARPAGGLGVVGVGDRTLQYPEGYAYEIPEGSAIVTEMSYRPTGRDVPVEGSVALQTAHPEDDVRRLGSFLIMKPWFRLAAGERRQEQAELVVPMDLDVVAMSPRGDHYLRTMKLTAIDPDGTSRVLLDYPDWDMHWRSTHILQAPMQIKAGTRLILDVDVDNSDDNPRNLNYPARNVTLGRYTGVDGIQFHATSSDPEKEEAFREWVGSLRR